MSQPAGSDSGQRIPPTDPAAFETWFADLESQLARQIHDDRYDRLLRDFATCSGLKSATTGVVSHLNSIQADLQAAYSLIGGIQTEVDYKLEQQNGLIISVEALDEKLTYFKELDGMRRKLASPSPLVLGESQLIPLLARLDECIQFMQSHQSHYRDADTYLKSYLHLQSQAMIFVRSQVIDSLRHTGRQVIQQSMGEIGTSATAAAGSRPMGGGGLLPTGSGSGSGPGPVPGPGMGPGGDDVFSLFYGQFQSGAPRIKSLMREIEERANRDPAYTKYMEECHESYFSIRDTLISPVLQMAIEDVFAASGVPGTGSNGHRSPSNQSTAGIPKTGQCGLLRNSTAMMMNICRDEYQLFFQFFNRPHDLLAEYLTSLCTSLYDRLRPAIIHSNHLETLSELCVILKTDIVDDPFIGQAGELDAFVRVMEQLLQDIQERLAYRTSVYMQENIIGYSPAAGDLAYPQKLVMMEQIAESLKDLDPQPQPPPPGLPTSKTGTLKRSDSMNSIISTVSDIAFAASVVSGRTMSTATSSRIAFSSPADLHGMWYPTVRRTLLCLEKLYRALDNSSTFQGLAQEVLLACITSLTSAADLIADRATLRDGQLFLIKHLLIVREQIAPFHIELTLRDVTIDLDRLKTAAMDLLSRRENLFKLNTNNALLRFMFDEAPQAVVEDLIDSQRALDAKIRSTCGLFIEHTFQYLCRPLIQLQQIGKTISSTSLVSNSNGIQSVSGQGSGSIPQLKSPTSHQNADLDRVRRLIGEQRKCLAERLPDLQRKMSLYLANRDTEIILFKPIKDKMMKTYIDVHRILNPILTAAETDIKRPPSTTVNDRIDGHAESGLSPTANPLTGVSTPADPVADPSNLPVPNPTDSRLWSVGEFDQLLAWPSAISDLSPKTSESQSP